MSADAAGMDREHGEHLGGRHLQDVRSRHRGWSRILDLPEQWVALGVYLIIRAITTVFTLIVAQTQVANLWTPQSPSYWDFAGIWDGSWYQQVAEHGYPNPLPVDAAGDPIQSGWAFFPAYPFTVRALMTVTGLPFKIAAPTVSLLIGCWAAVIVFKLFRLKSTRTVATGGVAIMAAFPSAPVMQFAYSESICILGLAGVLLYLTRRNYALAIPFAILVGLARPVGAALVATFAYVALQRIRHRRYDPITRNDVVGMLGLTVATTAASAVIPVAVAIVGHRLDAYTAVQLSWRAQPTMEYFTPWLGIARFISHKLFGTTYVGPVGLAVFVALVVAALLSRSARHLGSEMHGWCIMYTLYLFAVIDPFGQVFRMWLLLFPMFLALADVLRRRVLIEVWLVLSLALQLWWLSTLWRFSPPQDIAP